MSLIPKMKVLINHKKSFFVIYMAKTEEITHFKRLYERFDQ